MSGPPDAICRWNRPILAMAGAGGVQITQEGVEVLFLVARTLRRAEREAPQSHARDRRLEPRDDFLACYVIVRADAQCRSGRGEPGE
jgi:hypothetical protein